MAHVATHHQQHRHLHELPLGRRLLRFVLVSILVVAAVMIVQTVVMYLAMPKTSKATHHARAACGSFVDWVEEDGASGSPKAAAALRKATESARSAASLAPERWSPLLRDLSAAAAPVEEVLVAGPGIVAPRDRAISGALATCEPMVAGNRAPS